MISRLLISVVILFSSPAFAATETADLDLRVLSDADAALYSEIFDVQEDGDWRAADALIEKLDNRILMG